MLVQFVMIYNFMDKSIREDHGNYAKAGVAISFTLAIANALHIAVLLIFPSTLMIGIISFTFFLVAVCGMLPLLHHMILRLEADGQNIGHEGASWALNG